MIKLEKQFVDTDTTNDNIETRISNTEVGTEQEKDEQHRILKAEEQNTTDLKKDAEYFKDKDSSGKDVNFSAKKMGNERQEKMQSIVNKIKENFVDRIVEVFWLAVKAAVVTAIILVLLQIIPIRIQANVGQKGYWDVRADVDADVDQVGYWSISNL